MALISISRRWGRITPDILLQIRCRALKKSVLLNKIYNVRGYALILDTLLRHKGRMLTKKMLMTEAKTEPHTTIRVLRELHDSKVIYFDEQLDQIIWR